MQNDALIQRLKDLWLGNRQGVSGNIARCNAEPVKPSECAQCNRSFLHTSLLPYFLDSSVFTEQPKRPAIGFWDRAIHGPIHRGLAGDRRPAERLPGRASGSRRGGHRGVPRASWLEGNDSIGLEGVGVAEWRAGVRELGEELRLQGRGGVRRGVWRGWVRRMKLGVERVRRGSHLSAHLGLKPQNMVVGFPFCAQWTHSLRIGVHCSLGFASFWLSRKRNPGCPNALGVLAPWEQLVEPLWQRNEPHVQEIS